MGDRKKPKNLEDVHLYSGMRKVAIPWFIFERTLKETGISLDNLGEIKDHCDYIASEVRDAINKGVLTGEKKLNLYSEHFDFILERRGEIYYVTGALVREDEFFREPSKRYKNLFLKWDET